MMDDNECAGGDFAASTPLKLGTKMREVTIKDSNPRTYDPNESVVTFGGRVHPQTDREGIWAGQEFTVLWSNGAGESVYRVVDNPAKGPHLFELVSEREYC